MAEIQEVSNLHHGDDVQQLAVYSPDIWGDTFTSFILDPKLMETYNEKVEVLKEQVKVMIAGLGANYVETMSLVDTLERLGLSYHFEKEIEQLVEQTFSNYNDGNIDQEYDLFTTSLHFRIFRQHGHNMSSDVFTKFKDNKGKFMESIGSDVIGMLSLYEAAHLRTHGDGEILEEALSFTKTHLNKCLKTHNFLSSFLEKQVKHALGQALHRGIPRVEARHYIDVYEDLSSKDDTILELAKVDFNRLQLLHKQEISLISRYWDDSDLVTERSYARKRAVESYFWSASAYFEPQYSDGRLMLAKVVLLITLIDDTYDSYGGTFEELQHLTNAIQRWDARAGDQISTNTRPIYEGILKTYHEFDMELGKKNESHCIHYGKEAFKRQVRGYHIEAKWLSEGHTPTFEEYLVNAVRTSSHILLRSSLMGLEEYATVEAFEWIFSKPKIAKSAALIGRLLNDVAGHHACGGNSKKGASSNPDAVNCYMKQYNVSAEEAICEMYKRIEDAWKDINEALLCFNPTTAVPNRRVLMTVVNLTRVVDVLYKSGRDAYNDPKRLKNIVEAIYINPVAM